jgi:outer membrane receptor for ferrienterochelin and colicin
VAYKYQDNIETNKKTFDYASTEAENKIRYERLQRIGRIKLQYGAGFEDARYTAQTLRTYVYQDELKLYDYNSELNVLDWSLFGQLSQGFLDNRLTMSFGLRMDANNYSNLMNNLIDQTSPRLSGSYMLTEKFSLNGSIGMYFQQPALTTLGFRNNGGDLVNKNNDLKYIRSDQFVAGVEYSPDQKARISFEGFYKSYDRYPFSVVDSISIASKGGDFGTFGDEEVVPTSQGRAYGAEVYFHDKDFFGSNLIISYTLVRSEFSGKTSDYIPSAWDNRHILNITMSRSFKKNWDFGFKWRFLGGAPYTPYDELTSSYKLAWDTRGTGYLDYDKFNTERLGVFHQLDIRIDKQYFFDKWSLMLYLDIQNLYNFTADEAPILFNEDENGNTVIINPSDPIEQQRYQLRYINTESGTVLPTVGIMVEF